MANIQSAKKRIRQTEKRTARNRMYRASARSYIRKAHKLLDEGNLDEAKIIANKAYSTLDKAGRKRILHPRNVARRKGRLMAAMTTAQAAASEE